MAVTAITTDLLRSCIKIEGDISTEKLEERKRAMPLKAITCLQFSFRGLRAINYLDCLSSLTKLYLDNCEITKIQNLSHLTTLLLLDLSFNKIEKIEGLKNLTNLEDLTLYSNQIKHITGLDTLQNLSSLSLGRNRIRRLEDVVPLRTLKNLKVLTLDGNPVSTVLKPLSQQMNCNLRDQEYNAYVIAHMRELTYLDHRYVDKVQIQAAREQYQDDMMEMRQKEAEEDALAKAALEHADRQELYTDANLLGVDTLFSRMVSEDPDYPRLSQIPPLLASMVDYKDKYEIATEEIIGIILGEYRKKQEEIQLWQLTTNSFLDKRDAECRDLARSLRKLKKKIFAEVRLEPKTADAQLTLLRKENERIREKILEVEALAFGEAHDVWYRFDTVYQAIVDANKLQFQNYFGTIRILENGCSETIAAQASLLMEQFSIGELEVESDEGRALLRDKDTLLNAVQASHDSRTLKLDSLEDQRLRGEVDMQKNMNKEFRQRENKRNRERMEEIDYIYQTTIEEINDLIANLEVGNY